MLRAAILIALLAVAVGCGSDDDEASTASAAEVESALKSHLSQGGSGIVQLENDTPKRITCTKDAGSATGWRCTVTPSGSGDSYLCLVEVDPQTKQTTRITCARIDN